jgi:hypothetical protein
MTPGFAVLPHGRRVVETTSFVCANTNYGKFFAGIRRVSILMAGELRAKVGNADCAVHTG